MGVCVFKKYKVSLHLEVNSFGIIGTQSPKPKQVYLEVSPGTDFFLLSEGVLESLGLYFGF